MVFKRLAKVTASDGYLMLGAAETVVGLTDTFRPVPDRRGLYSPNAPRAPSIVPDEASLLSRVAATTGR